MSLSAEEIEAKWVDFKVKFERKYSDDEEEKMRKDLFAQNVAMVEEHNEKHKQGLVTYTMGINHFSDRTAEEKKKSCGFGPPRQ